MSARSLPPAAAGGLTAALVSSLVRSASEPRWDPTFCPVVPPESDILWYFDRTSGFPIVGSHCPSAPVALPAGAAPWLVLCKRSGY